MIMPKLEPEAPMPKALPAMAIVCLTPGISIAIRCTWSMAAFVRSIEAASGNSTGPYRKPMSCAGMNPFGAVVKKRYVTSNMPA